LKSFSTKALEVTEYQAKGIKSERKKIANDYTAHLTFQFISWTQTKYETYCLVNLIS
jgi:hypothetical protein